MAYVTQPLTDGKTFMIKYPDPDGRIELFSSMGWQNTPEFITIDKMDGSAPLTIKFDNIHYHPDLEKKLNEALSIHFDSAASYQIEINDAE